MKNNNRPEFIRCYDCNAQVRNLKEHRLICTQSRKSKTEMNLSKHSSDVSVPSKVLKFPSNFILLDVSGSMHGSKLEECKDAIKQVFDSFDKDERFSLISFESKAFMKLKPRPVGELRRKNEIPELLNRIFAQGSTALYDAIFLAIEQVRYKDTTNRIIVFTDGEDNCSRHSLNDCMKLISEYPKLKLDIIHIGVDPIPSYESLVKSAPFGGEYRMVLSVTLVLEYLIKK